MTIPVQLHPAGRTNDPVRFRWDAETDILTAALPDESGSGGLSGSLEFAGEDGAWIVLDVRAGAIASVEVAVWPEVLKRPTLELPSVVEDARVIVPDRLAPHAPAVVQVDTTLAAESDDPERTIHFRLGQTRRTRTVRMARDVLLDIDDRGGMAGLWLLNVPPFPELT